MLKRIIRFSAENRFLVIGAVLVLLVISVWVMRHIPLDALPDLSDTQVIVYSRWDRSPDILEDQVTYPIISALLGAPKVKAIRGFSDFGYSFVYVIFEDGTDIYWARTRVLEYLSKITATLPQGVKTELGPDAIEPRLGLPVRAGGHLRPAHQRRTAQLPGLVSALRDPERAGRQSEVAAVGGQVRQYQITVNPSALAAYGLPLDMVLEAVRKGNGDVGGRLVEIAGTRVHGARPRLREVAWKTSNSSC